MASCPICYESYTSTGQHQPLLLACCKGGSCCRACIITHVEKGASRCIICPKRPTRHFVQNCEDATPDNYIHTLQNAWLRECNEEPVRRVQANGTLFEDYVTSRQVRGDEEQAIRLHEEMNQELQQKLQREEEANLRLAQELQAEFEAERQELSRKLTKTKDVTVFQPHTSKSSSSKAVSAGAIASQRATVKSQTSRTGCSGSSTAAKAGDNKPASQAWWLSQKNPTSTSSGKRNVVASPHPGVWSCTLCTTMNTDLLPYCETCENPRTSHISHISTAAALVAVNDLTVGSPSHSMHDRPSDRILPTDEAEPKPVIEVLDCTAATSLLGKRPRLDLTPRLKTTSPLRVHPIACSENDEWQICSPSTFLAARKSVQKERSTS